VTRYRVTAATFERIPQEFCQENLVLPVGQVGELLLVAFANPFDLTVSAKINEMTGKRVVRLLAREKTFATSSSREAPTARPDSKTSSRRSERNTRPRPRASSTTTM